MQATAPDTEATLYELEGIVTAMEATASDIDDKHRGVALDVLVQLAHQRIERLRQVHVRGTRAPAPAGAARNGEGCP